MLLKYMRQVPLVVLLLLISLFMGAAVAWAGAADEQLFKKIEASLMCTDGCGMYLPSCDNANAEKMRAEIKNQLRAGASEQEIYAYMIGLYGPEVMASPPKDNPLNYTAWVLPFVLILGGGLVIYLALDRWVFNNRRTQVVEVETELEVPLEYQEVLDDQLKKYL